MAVFTTLTTGHIESGAAAISLAAWWAPQSCQTPPVRLEAMASRSPALASPVARRTPARPRATRSVKILLHATQVSTVVIRSPRTRDSLR